MAWVRWFDDEAPTLDEVGGKAVNLSRLTRAGFPVPPGFAVTTEAFRAALRETSLGVAVAAALAETDATDLSSAERAAQRIRAAFAATPVPADVAGAVLDAYRRLGDTPVAVRSSATAEDLPDLSFAGQQDTFLGVTGEAEVLTALARCWASLWTARAITYRHRAGIPEHAAALAVAVQQMVPADVSGVLFTANPLTGHRGEMTVDATFGLGEALVSGLVEPDHYVLDGADGRVLRRTLGAKAVVTSSRAGGRVETRPSDRADARTLDDDHLQSLAELGRAVQEEYGTPQDIEWALADGRLALLQARAITSLFPVPDGASADSVWLSFGSLQGVLAPLSPLGQDVLACFLAGPAILTGTSLTPESSPWVRPAGDRLWIRVDRVLRNPLGRRVGPVLLGIGDPGARDIVLGLVAASPGSPRPAGMRVVGPRVARLLAHVARILPRAARHPERVRAELDMAVDDLVDQAVRAFAVAATEPDPLRRAAARAATLREAALGALPALLPYAGAVIAAPLLALRLLSRLAGEPAEAGHGVAALVLEVTRAVPHNVTTEMDLALWHAAATARNDPRSSRLLGSLTPAELADRYARGELPGALTDGVRTFLDTYGMRAVAEIDVGRPRWRDDPADVFATISRFQDIPEDQSPPVQFARGAAAAVTAVDRLAAGFGPVRARLIRGLAARVRALAGGRELPKFTLVRILGVARDALLESGRDLVAADVLDAPGDVFLLRLAELESLPAGSEGLRDLAAGRGADLVKEGRRARVPRAMAGDGRAFFEGVSGRDLGRGTTVGSPVSPGVVEGAVRVVLDPSHADLRHGEILVCPGTDPAWTPLFLMAGGLVTEVGGMMTHGSVVAREYGIPAVVGVHEATTRLVTGQRVRLDGSSGTITLLDDEAQGAFRVPEPAAAGASA